ncbi:MAG: hypothetical protein A2977_00615 [Alphaproteobacteria bacterium RIFCSPLOWO2_01_FULL_45_8]|nr:MAG: hypothetical protein A2065_01030 [Alphaproteobacteria bacterium GWB1_45_5]OFW75976.1 MAG: hypothetical protein A3K20_04020 [Alphaproteobacteria bacterium GWA1_45_9]OFW89635.1 MAG: hypothetical protein A2621_01850 [Alphaproteobacteria bacterium RIFCSPHIGHO2_01_FULL_41_14]OFW96581.1 MAG: hypothetical protein A2977_00615 [Alphaproteobacteria bacterium RIFCSPLOWO2_01_FULL_45_8]HCI49074.1 hypothetical protein [Holosporales bacterium]
MNFEKLKVFYSVARHSSVPKGAEELSISADSAEKLISTLEQDLKTLLFNRRQELWTLTLQGELLFRKTRIILSEIESARNILDENSRDDVSGPLRVITTPSLASLWISRYLPGFLEKYPDVRLSISPLNHTPDVTLGEADVLIQPLISDGQNIIQHYIMTWHVGLYASPDYVRKFGIPKTTDELDNHRLIAITTGQDNAKPYREVDWFLTIGKRADDLPREPYLRIQSSQPLIDCVLSGIGIGSLSEELPIIKQGRLVRILPELPGPEVDIFFIYPQILANSKRVIAFRDYLIEKVNQQKATRERVLFIH